jgi:hypothetical protein
VGETRAFTCLVQLLRKKFVKKVNLTPALHQKSPAYTFCLLLHCSGVALLNVFAWVSNAFLLIYIYTPCNFVLTLLVFLQVNNILSICFLSFPTFSCLLIPISSGAVLRLVVTSFNTRRSQYQRYLHPLVRVHQTHPFIPLLALRQSLLSLLLPSVL